MPVHEIKYVIVPVCVFIIAVWQVNVCRVGAYRARTFCIIARFVVNTHYLPSLLRLLFINGRNRIGLVHKAWVVLRTVGSFRAFLLLIRR